MNGNAKPSPVSLLAICACITGLAMCLKFQLNKKSTLWSAAIAMFKTFSIVLKDMVADEVLGEECYSPKYLRQKMSQVIGKLYSTLQGADPTMKMNTAVRLLQLLPVRGQEAITVSELANKWYERKPSASDIRNIQRYMKDLATEGKDEPALVDVVQVNPPRFYLKLSRVADWFMTEEAALNILLTRQVLGQPLESLNQLGSDKLIDVAETVADASVATTRIRERVRIVPDGIGRLSARITPGVLQVAIDAVIKQKQLNFNYVSSKGTESLNRVSPQGLVAKDGTIYLLATKELSDKPRHFPLHRMSDVQLDHRALQTQPDFDLDRYIEDSNQLSHTLYDESVPIELKLRVAPETLYHFKERPLSSDQSIGPEERHDGWCIVTANVPYSLLLVPFLLSMRDGIEVVGPPIVRKEISDRLRTAAAHYASDSPE